MGAEAARGGCAGGGEGEVREFVVGVGLMQGEVEEGFRTIVRKR